MRKSLPVELGLVPASWRSREDRARPPKAIDGIFFYTGAPCRNGHVAPRYISTKKCAQCQADRAQRWGLGSELHESKMLRSARSRAKAFGLPFNLVIEDIVIPKFCPIDG